MDEKAFAAYLRKGGRSASAVKRCLAFTRQFEHFLRERGGGKTLDQANPGNLEDFVAAVESEPQASAKTHLWAIRYYYLFAANENMARLAAQLREQRIQRTPFPLRQFRGVDPEQVEKLAAIGIQNVEQMLRQGRTSADRQALAERAGVPLAAIVELVKLSDLSRIFGVKGVRARLYHDAGVDTLEKMAEWDPDKLRAMVAAFVEQTGFDGIAPLPKEAQYTVAQAKRLPKIVKNL